MKAMKKNLSPEFWVTTIVLAAFMAGFVVWTKTAALASDDFGSFTYHKKLLPKKASRR